MLLLQAISMLHEEGGLKCTRHAAWTATNVQRKSGGTISAIGCRVAVDLCGCWLFGGRERRREFGTVVGGVKAGEWGACQA